MKFLQTINKKNLHSILKKLILIELFFLILTIVLEMFSDGYFLIPKPIKDFVIAYENGISDQYYESYFNIFILTLILLIFYLTSLFYLWRLRKIGRKLYLIVNVVTIIIFPFALEYSLYGPIDEIINYLSTIVFSFILVIVFYSPLAKMFKK